MRRAFNGDLDKTLRSGKSVVLDGLHVDPGMYMWEFGMLDAMAPKLNSSVRDDMDSDVHAKLSPGMFVLHFCAPVVTCWLASLSNNGNSNMDVGHGITVTCGLTGLAIECNNSCVGV